MKEADMLVVAAILTIAVSLMHSVLGERHLVAPLLRMRGLPVILGSVEHTRRTIRAAWHLTTLLWWGLAVVLIYLQFGGERLAPVFLWMVAAVFLISGAFALVLSRGAHRSWVFFFPVAAIAAYAAYLG